MTSPVADCARVSVFVRVEPRDAFAVFTEEIDRWWKTGPKFRIAGRRRGAIFLEPRLGGRLFETFETNSGPTTVEVGQILSWDPPLGFSLEWRGANFKRDESTRVEVTFEALGEGTMVRVEHRGWSGIPDDHPVRHGELGAAFIRTIGMWWGELMTSLREHVAGRS